MTEIGFAYVPRSPRIVFRMGGKKGTARYSPYGWLAFYEYEIAARTMKLDFSRYDVGQPSYGESFARQALRGDCTERAARSPKRQVR